MTALIILQLIFLLPFAIHFALLLYNSLTGQKYKDNKIVYYLGIFLLVLTIAALLVPSAGILSFIVFVNYFYFLFLIFFRSSKVKVAKNPLMVISKILLLITPVALLVIINVYFNQQIGYPSSEVLNSTTTGSDISNLTPSQTQGVAILPLATLLMLSSSILQLISLTVDILLDKIAINKHANK